MRLVIAAVVAGIISGCTGSGVTDIATLEKGPYGKTWAQEAVEPKGGE